MIRKPQITISFEVCTETSPPPLWSDFYQKERGPEDEIGRGDDHVHLDPGNALRLQMSDVLLDLDTLGRSDGEKVLAVLTGERNLIESPAVSEQQVSLCSYGTLSVGIYHSLSSVSSGYLFLGFNSDRKQSVNPQSLNIRLGEVLVEFPQVEDGQHDTEQIDQDPDGIEDIMSVGSLT